MKVISMMILALLIGTCGFAQIRGDSCVGKMNDINSDLSNLARQVERIVQASALDEVEKGRSFIKHGKTEHALKCLKKAIKLNANCYQAYGFHAILLQQEGRLDQAKVMFIDSLNAFNRKKRIFVQDQEGTLKAIVKELVVIEKQLDDLSANSLLIDGVGDAYNTKDKLLKTDMMKRNIEAYLTHERSAIFPAYFRLGFGNLYFRTKNYKAALEQYEAGLIENPESPELNANLASVLFVLGQKQKALKYFRKAVALKASITPTFHKEMNKYIESLKSEGQPQAFDK